MKKAAPEGAAFVALRDPFNRGLKDIKVRCYEIFKGIVALRDPFNRGLKDNYFYFFSFTIFT